MITVFITGASVLVIELVGTRALAPFFGSGIYTWSALISITLAALSIGYFVGGKMSDRFPQKDNIFLIIIAAGIWTIVTPWLATIILPQLSVHADLRIAVLIASIILFFPNLSMLGAICPYSIRLLTESHLLSGSVSGIVFAISTVGSLLGAITTGFFLIPNFGVRTIFFYCGTLLVLLGFLGSFNLLNKNRSIAATIITAFLFSIYLSSKQKTPSTVELIDQKPSFYGHVQVVKKNDIKMLLVDGIGQNYLYENLDYSTPYINFMSSLPDIKFPKLSQTELSQQSALVIGLGAGELPTLLNNKNIKTDIVEIDPTVTNFAAKHFGFKRNLFTTHHMDGRVFLSQTENIYDYIFMDAFNAEQISWQLVSREAFITAKEKLSKNGLLSLNLTSTPNNQDVISIQQTLYDVFPNVRSFVFDPNSELTSIVYIASLKPIEIPHDFSKLNPLAAHNIEQFLNGEQDNYLTKAIYTDDFNPVSDQRHQIHRLWRKKMREFLNDDELLWLNL